VKYCSFRPSDRIDGIDAIRPFLRSLKSPLLESSHCIAYRLKEAMWICVNLRRDAIARQRRMRVWAVNEGHNVKAHQLLRGGRHDLRVKLIIWQNRNPLVSVKLRLVRLIEEKPRTHEANFVQFCCGCDDRW
jgi:hypothetical protein